MNKYMFPCLNKKFFGIDCLGCGAQRAFGLILEGNFYDAIKMFPAIYTILLLISFLILHVADKKRNYSIAIITSAILNAIIMIISYFYKIIHL